MHLPLAEQRYSAQFNLLAVHRNSCARFSAVDFLTSGESSSYRSLSEQRAFIRPRRRLDCLIAGREHMDARCGSKADMAKPPRDVRVARKQTMAACLGVHAPFFIWRCYDIG